MEIRAVGDKNEWHGGSGTSAQFLQSWEWGEVQARAGHTPLRLVIGEGETKKYIQGFVTRLPLGYSFISFPRIATLTRDECAALSQYLKIHAGGCLFFRVEPIEDEIAPSEFRVPNRQPRTTLILSLLPSYDEILSAMHAKTRYNIRLAEKKGVEIREEKDSDAFWQLTEETSLRDHIRSHDRAHYETILDSPLATQITAWYEGKPIASNILISYGDTVTYLHGASSNESRNVMAPYLLQWGGIAYAKEQGFLHYDFWGVAPEATKDTPASEFNGYTWSVSHPWTGVTRFKTGFGGARVSYGEAYEVPVRPWLYKVFRLVKRFV